MKILVTGANGFLGSNLIEYLIKLDVKIIATSRNLETAKNKSWYSNSEVNFIEYNFNRLNDTEENLFEYFEKPDLLINLAWEGLPNYNNVSHFENNLFHQFQFIKNLIDNGLKNINITGTCLEYGLRNGVLNEDLPTNPQNCYAIAKDSLRRMLFELNKSTDFSLKWIRLFYMYGQGQNQKSLVPQLLSAIEKEEEVFNMSMGNQLRDYLPIDKVIEYLFKISIQNKICGQINLCSGKPISVRELVEKIIQKNNSNIKLNLGYYKVPNYEPFAFWGNNLKLQNILEHGTDKRFSKRKTRKNSTAREQ